MLKDRGIITDIGRASIHDGAGFRTTVFFKGCPLSCVWCHNPECISYKPQVLFYPEKCIGCNMCDKGCYSGARVVCGKEMTADEVMSQIRLDKPYYGQTGGVTFTGGEAFAQHEFLNTLVDLCKAEGINVAAETSLYIFKEEIIKKLDFIMADLKIWDEEKHIKYTGSSNKTIKENFEKLDQLGIPFIVRTPLIPGITDNAENISKIRDFIKGFKNIQKYELLPYNPLGNAKRKAMGEEKIDFEAEQTSLKELMKYAEL